ncbi:MAG TPA: SDR family NAD(P)-dependent oxidoreductase, partial [Acidimicrobiia bacterium]|nr:SDR family NAD(P)-dependent oxidoreductase [Acidimicrobiia bacterium]
MNVKDRVAVITGSGQGIGAGIAAVLGAAGARIVVNDLDPHRVDGSRAELETAGIAVTGVTSDVSTAAGAAALIAGALDAFGRIDILVNNAGIARDGLLVKMSEEDWDDVLRVNLKSQFLCARAAAPPMMEQKSGRIINISSRA